MKKKDRTWKDQIPSVLSTILFVSQIILGIFLLPEITQISMLAYIGTALYILSGFIFGMLPIFEFREKGRVKKGKSYVHTTKLVNTGIYSIVRHPQYVTFVLFGISGMFLFQHWIVILLGLLIIPLTYIDLKKADLECVSKFGDEYIQYMQKVPQANFLLGIIRLYRNRNR